MRQEPAKCAKNIYLTLNNRSAIATWVESEKVSILGCTAKWIKTGPRQFNLGVGIFYTTPHPYLHHTNNLLNL